MDGFALLTADWDEIAFLHFPVPAALLQPSIPYELELHAGQAWVSVVTFTQRRLRLAFGDELAGLLTLPLANHAFCNLRTYVRHRGRGQRERPGIFLIAEWIPNALARALGPHLYDLPYRGGTLDLRHDHRVGRAAGTVRDDVGRGLEYQLLATPYYTPVADPLDVFLIERYTAYTGTRGRRRFEIEHDPWQLARGTVDLANRGMIDHALPAVAGMAPARCHLGPGVRDVLIGLPLGAGRALAGVAR